MCAELEEGCRVTSLASVQGRRDWTWKGLVAPPGMQAFLCTQGGSIRKCSFLFANFQVTLVVNTKIDWQKRGPRERHWGSNAGARGQPQRPGVEALRGW